MSLSPSGQLAALQLSNVGQLSLDLDLGDGIFVKNGVVQAQIAAYAGGVAIGAFDANIVAAVIPMRLKK